MKLIINQTDLEKEFKRLTKQYQTFYWATAWAGINSKPFEDLITYESKIKQVVVGIHFYQTHPDFIFTFIKNKNVHYILQPEGTFHPKIYLFSNSESDWEIIIGSGNFTNGAFNTNKEAAILVSNNDNNSKAIYKDAKEFIGQAWKEGKTLNNKELEKYRIAWKNHRPKINSLSGRYGSKTKVAKPIYEVAVINKTWREFISQVKNETSHGVNRRLRVIEIANNLFTRVEHFSELLEEERKFVAGIPNKFAIQGAEDWGYFGSMKGAGIFKNKIITNDSNISKALDQIPISGQITRKHYESFIKLFHRIFIGTRLETANNIATASRLLAMKRPDVFVCYDVENKGNLSRDFGIVQKDMNYDRYWDDIIERIYDCEWWLNPDPIDTVERKVSNARAAFLDSLYYEQ
jgi:hypothetical protein